jgi:hypothetical protein
VNGIELEKLLYKEKGCVHYFLVTVFISYFVFLMLLWQGVWHVIASLTARLFFWFGIRRIGM